MNEAIDYLEVARERILGAIDRSERGKWSIKIKTLMAEFGFVAVQRVRQSSFLDVLGTLNQWGIEYTYNGNAANDYITLSRTHVSPPVQPTTSQPSTPTIKTMEIVSPLAFLFHVGALDETRSQAISVDVQSAVWSFKPVCFLVEAGEEFFSFICGFFSAIMRRRALMVRHGVLIESVSYAPEIITVDHLKRHLGQAIDFYSQGTFPQSGAVYILRDSPDDVEDDEVIALVRECFIPHTYRIRAKFATTSGDASQGHRAIDDTDFHQIVEWMSAFASTFQLPQIPVEQQIDLASLLAEAIQTRDTLLERQTLRPSDAAFRAGFESTEHMVLKSALLNGLRRSYPNETISVEELVDPRKDDAFADQDTVDSSRRDKPDIRIGNTLWIEVETMRALSLRGSNPLFALESKLRQKLNNMRAAQEVWLIVPNDIALLANEQLYALVRNLNTALESKNKLRCGFMDVLAETPVFLNHEVPIPATDVRLSGISWRTKKLDKTSPLTWSDIAGYSDLKERLREDLLDPLLEPEKYSRHGLFAANGLLLYGLPGCGKSLIGRVLAGETGLVCRLIMPSDMTSMWLGEGVMKIRALFDWALKQSPCLLVLDELDAVAPQRKETNMHADEKRQVNELLSQLDRIAGKGVVVVATTNYVRGIDTAIQRSGRFDVKLPVFPPDEKDRAKIFEYYLSPPRLKEFKDADSIDTKRLAEESFLFTPADIKVVVQTVARHAIRGTASHEPSLSTESISKAIRQHPRSIRHEMARDWVREATEELGCQDEKILWLEEEIGQAFSKSE